MRSTQKLLSIRKLKKYFPVAEKGLFRKEQPYLRANEAVSLDIYRGETFGLVGESGCGKSTLGRTILQLYAPTAGQVLYFGRGIRELMPAYVARTLKNAPKLIARQKALQQKADILAAQCAAAGEQATFQQLQRKDLAAAQADTMLRNIAGVLGGFVALEDCREGAAALLAEYTARARLQAPGPLSLSRLAQLQAEAETCAETVTHLRQRYAADPDFARYEAMRTEGIDLSRLNPEELRILRKDIQIIFQDPYSSLNPRMTVGQLIEEGLITHRIFRPGDPQMRPYVLDIMARCGLQAHMYHRYPHQFSGGQRQRVSIARALAVKPKFIVCDECVSALDVSIQSQIIHLLQELKQTQQLTYLFISHDLSVVRYLSDRIGVMYLGELVELGAAEAVFRDPRHPYTVALLSAIPSTDPDAVTRPRILLGGHMPSPIRPPGGCKFHTRCYMACDKCVREAPALLEVAPGHFAACHFPDRKLDDNGAYLFPIPE